ncbi:MAG TPA: transglutaminase-like domain-containing protein [Stellaceae bacterium]|nr:transglutaminase-like domain-containing protein [Stellaceae bacterium]
MSEAARDHFGDGAAAEAFLRALGRSSGERLPLAEGALALAALAGPAVDVARYREHLALLARAVDEAAAAAHDLKGSIAALNRVLYGRFGYSGDTTTYDDPQNANLMDVIDRRKGLPVALGIIAIHAARAQGWDMAGLSFPGHFLVRIEHAGERAILDPFNGGRTRNTAELRELLSAIAGRGTALAPQHYAPVSDREVLERLQNNLKLRHLENGEPAKALDVVERTLLLAPNSAPLLREAGLLQLELGNLGAAVTALERFLEVATEGAERRRVALLLERVRLRIN